MQKAQAFQFNVVEAMVHNFLDQGRSVASLSLIFNIPYVGASKPIIVGERKRKMVNIEGPSLKKLMTTAEYNKISITNDSKIIIRPLKKLYACVNTKGLIDCNTSIVYTYGYTS